MLASYQAMQVSASNRQHQCTLQANVVRPEQDLVYGKTNQAYNGKYTDRRVCVCVYVCERDCAFMQNTNASCLANMEMSFKMVCTFKCTTEQRYSVQLSKIKPFFKFTIDV